MTQKEASDLWVKTPAGNRHQPISLAQRWRVRNNASPNVQDIIEMLQLAANSPELKDPEIAPAYAARLIATLVEKFEPLVEKGCFDEVLPRLPGLPILYSPKAGKGAGGWKHAAELFEKKGIATDCLQEHWGTVASRNELWRSLAHDTIWVIQTAAFALPELSKKQRTAIQSWNFKKSRHRTARTQVGATLFRLPAEELLFWPKWLDACASIPRPAPNDAPLPVRHALAEYLHAARAILDDFFSNAENPYAAEILRVVQGVRTEMPPASAVAEARKNVLDTIKRM